MEQTNGFVGGAVNGAIVGTISAIPGAGPAAGYFANGIGGFAGNMITENLNNLDGANKSQGAIFATSLSTGIGQALVGGAYNHLGIANGISTAAEGGMSYYIWQGFSNLAGFSAGGSVYIGADYASRKMLDNCTTNE